MSEEDVPAQYAQAEEEARVPPQDADAGGASHSGQQAGKGPEKALCLGPETVSLRGGRRIRAVVRGGRRARGEQISVASADLAETGPARVGITIRRELGSAVERNRLKRRIRIAAGRCELEGGVGYMIWAEPGAKRTSVWDLQRELQRLSSLSRQLGPKAGVGGGARSVLGARSR